MIHFLIVVAGVWFFLYCIVGTLSGRRLLGSIAPRAFWERKHGIRMEPPDWKGFRHSIIGGERVPLSG